MNSVNLALDHSRGGGLDRRSWMLISDWIVDLVVKLRFRAGARLSRRVGAGFHGSGLVFRLGTRAFDDQGEIGGGRASVARRDVCSCQAQCQVSGMRILRLGRVTPTV